MMAYVSAYYIRMSVQYSNGKWIGIMGKCHMIYAIVWESKIPGLFTYIANTTVFFYLFSCSLPPILSYTSMKNVCVRFYSSRFYLIRHTPPYIVCIAILYSHTWCNNLNFNSQHHFRKWDTAFWTAPNDMHGICTFSVNLNNSQYFEWNWIAE